MRKVKRWRYYCDFCKKSGASEYHMRNHEKHCTSNPNRECRICNKLEEVQQPLVELTRAYKDGGLKELRAIAGDCPMCILTTLKACINLNDWTGEPWDENPWENSFDFKKELDAFWQSYNDSQQEYY